MPISSLLLVLVAAFIHAGWNLLAKKASGGAPFVWLYGLVACVVYQPVAVVFWMRDDGVPHGWTWLFVVGTAVLHLGYALSLQRGYRAADLTVVYPVARGTGPLLSTIGAIVLLGERPGLLGLAGAGAVVVGVLLVAGGPRVLRVRDPMVRAGVRHGAITGVWIASYTLLDGKAVRSAAVGPLLLDYLGNILRTVLLAPTVLSRRDALREQWVRNRRFVIGVGALSPLSYVFVLFAVQRAPLSHVAPARELSMLVAALVGSRLLRERDAAWRVAGAICIAGGVVALALS